MPSDPAPPTGPQGTLQLDQPGVLGPAAEPDSPTLMTPAASENRVPPPIGAVPPPAPELPRAPIDRAAPRHVLVKMIGKGAMGEVHIAEDPELRRRVAFKRLHAELVDNPRLSARFLSEVQVTAQLDHPNIVPINGMELATDGTLGYSMKLIQGKDLQKLIEKWRGEQATAPRKDERRRLASRLDIFLRICEAMTYAHEKRVLHRDLKPENVMVGRFNEVYVMDWGIFRVLGDPGEENRVSISPSAVDAGGHGQTLDGSVIGTPAYMSPEQAAGKISELDVRSDVCALGLILHQMISLRPARRGADVDALLEQAKGGQVEPLVHLDKRFRIARELRAIVAKATALDKQARYATVRELADDVRRYLRGDAVKARPDTPLQAAARFVGRHRAVALGAILALLVVGAGIVALQVQMRQRAALAAQRHQTAVQELATTAARQADRIDNEVYRWESNVSRFVGRAAEALETVAVYDPTLPIYPAGAFDAERDGPDDLATSSRYHRKISVAWPVVHTPSSVSLEGELRATAHRIAGMAAELRALLLGSAGPSTQVLPDDRVRALLLGEGVPALRAFVSLESGLHVSYPGHGGYEPGYDARRRPKYESVARDETPAGRREIHWGDVFKDRYGLGFVLPAGGAVVDRDGAFVGVAGTEISLDWIATHLLLVERAPWVRSVHLLDPKGRVVVSVTQEGAVSFPEVPGGGGEGVEIPFPRFEHERAVASVAAGAGVVPIGGGRLVAFYPLESLHWTYAVVADEAALLAEVPGDQK